jgi:hypothetical protein
MEAILPPWTATDLGRYPPLKSLPVITMNTDIRLTGHDFTISTSIFVAIPLLSGFDFLSVVYG